MPPHRRDDSRLLLKVLPRQRPLVLIGEGVARLPDLPQVRVRVVGLAREGRGHRGNVALRPHPFLLEQAPVGAHEPIHQRLEGRRPERPGVDGALFGGRRRCIGVEQGALGVRGDGRDGFGGQGEVGVAPLGPVRGTDVQPGKEGRVCLGPLFIQGERALDADVIGDLAGAQEGRAAEGAAGRGTWVALGVHFAAMFGAQRLCLGGLLATKDCLILHKIMAIAFFLRGQRLAVAADVYRSGRGC